MAISAKLCNATPFDAEIPYDKGVVLRVRADDSLPLTSLQMESFDPSKPGWEESRQILEGKGLFLLDTDIGYDFQALKVLRSCIRSRKERINGFVERLEAMSTREGGVIDTAKIETAKKKAGISRLEDEISKMEKRVESLEKAIGPNTKKSMVEQLDPARTCFALSPPKEFPSKIALQIFLDENPEFRVKNDEILNKMFPKKQLKEAE